MRRITALSAVLALFMAGVLVGVVATHGFYLYKVRQPGGLGELGSRVMAWELERRLDLTPEQQTAIAEILGETRREGLEIRQRTIAEVLALLERNHVRLAAVLTSEQRAEFERFRARHRRLVEGLFSAL